MRLESTAHLRAATWQSNEFCRAIPGVETDTIQFRKILYFVKPFVKLNNLKNIMSIDYAVLLVTATKNGIN